MSVVGVGGGGSAPKLEPSRQAKKIETLDEPTRDHRRDRGLKTIYAVGILAMTLFEITIVNVLFWTYLHQNKWVASASVINVWLGASVIQVFGVILVVTRHLFPTPRATARALRDSLPTTGRVGGRTVQS